MANVTIDIPGVGNVVAENAASEETLLKLLAVMSKSEKAKRDEEKKAAEELIKAKKAEEEQSKKLAGHYGAEEKKAAERAAAESKRETQRQQAYELTSSRLLGFGATLGKTAIALAGQFTKSYEAMAKDPIGAAAGMLSTGIDLIHRGAKVATGALSGIPIIGPGLSKAADAAADLAAAMAKTANDVLAAEFKKSAQQLAEYTKQGASFAGGMTEMRNVAHSAGLSIETMGKIAGASAEDVRSMGLSQGEGAKVIANGMSAAAKTIGRSGNSMRDEMLALGYNYEEQGAIMAQYMAQQKASGQLEKMTTEEIAKGTKDYAVNLKVLSDITGQDAKKLMEKARQESMRGALMNKLQGEQQTAFKGAYATLSKFGPDVQEALMQQLTGGAITNPTIAANAELSRLVQETAEQVQSGNKDIITTTSRSMAETRERIGKDGNTEILDQAALMSRGGAALAKSMSDINNNIMASGMTPEMAEESKKAAVAQSESNDKVTKGFQDVTAAGTKAAMTMEDLASKALPVYATFLGTSLTKTVEAFAAGIKAITGQGPSVGAPPVRGTEGTAPMGETAGNAAVGARLNVRRSTLPAAPGPGKAYGGILQGPLSGYTTTLHGTEAVVPLDNQTTSSSSSHASSDSGVSMGLSALADIFKETIAKQEEMIRVMSDNRDYTERLMHNMS